VLGSTAEEQMRRAAADVSSAVLCLRLKSILLSELCRLGSSSFSDTKDTHCIGVEALAHSSTFCISVCFWALCN
jgi:hypothetical protein